MIRTTRQTFVLWTAALVLAPLAGLHAAENAPQAGAHEAGAEKGRAAATLHKDIEYARPGDVSLKLDASIPDGAGPFSAVIIVHGGGFTAGNKQQYVTPIFEPLSRAGFAWFSIDYRLAPKFPYPAAIEDIDQAIEFVKAHAAEYKIAPDRIALLGESAGGHLVSYVGTQTDRRWSVAAVVSFYGPHNLMGEYEMRKSRGKPPVRSKPSWRSRTSIRPRSSASKKRRRSITSGRRCRPTCWCMAATTRWWTTSNQ